MVFSSLTVVLLFGCRPFAQRGAGQRERTGAVLADADLGQRARDQGPDGLGDGEPHLTDGHDVADGQFPGRFSRVAEPPPWGGIWEFL
jgi:hypothetical protein